MSDGGSRWERVKQLFQSVLERPLDEHEAHVVGACEPFRRTGDPEQRPDGHHERAGA